MLTHKEISTVLEELNIPRIKIFSILNADERIKFMEMEKFREEVLQKSSPMQMINNNSLLTAMAYVHEQLLKAKNNV